MRGQPPQSTFKPAMTYRYDFARDVHMILANDKVTHEVTNEQLQTVIKTTEEMAALFKQASAVVAEMIKAFSKTFEREMVQAEARGFVPQVVQRARAETREAMAPEPSPDWQHAIAVMYQEIEEEPA